jgi:osmotically inducible protein OsmC
MIFNGRCIIVKPIKMKRTSTVVWHGAGNEGSGQITTQSKALQNAPYAWGSRFADEKGTNPEELIAAAHASCFTMKLSFLLNEAGFSAETIETKSTVALEDSTITESHLVVNAKVPGITAEKFEQLAEKSRNECPVSKALNMKISMEAKLIKENEYSPDESFIV